MRLKDSEIYTVGSLVTIRPNSERNNAIETYTARHGGKAGLVVDVNEYENENFGCLVNFGSDLCWINSEYLCKVTLD